MPLLIIAIYKLIFYGLAFFYATVLPNLFSQKWYLLNFVWPESPTGHYWKYFLTWDAQHYLYLSREGYHPGQLSNAFYPLWPFLIRVFTEVSRLSPALSGFILANLLSIAGFILFYRYTKAREGADVGNVSLLLLVAFPGAIYFSLIYTESLFLVFTVLFLMQLEARRYWTVALLSFMMVLTKSVGILTLVPILASLIIHRERVPKWLALLAPFSGLVVYLWVMQLQTGDFLAGMRVQSVFAASPSISKWFDLVGFTKAFFHPEMTFHGMLNSFIDRMWFVFFLLSLPLLWRWDKICFFYALPMGLIPAMSVSFMSYTRFFAVLVPAFIVIAKVIAGARKPVILVAVLIFLFLLQGFFLLRHLNNYWTG